MEPMKRRSCKFRAAVIATVILITCGTAAIPPASAADSSPIAAQTTSPQNVSASWEAMLRGWIESGQLPGLLQPDFGAYRDSVQDFYRDAGYALAWVWNGRPTPQGLATLEAFRDADTNALDGKDYDAPLWSARLSRLQQSKQPPSDSDLASFDLALTVCAMRYISDLHIGRVNPKTLHFGLDVEHKKYNLAEFLRQKLVDADAGDVKSVLDSVEPPFEAYRRTRTAFRQYEELAAKDDGEQLLIPRKPVKPGDNYSGIARLARLLHLVGDLPLGVVVNADQQIYDGVLAEAVKHFQERHGLTPSGRLDGETVEQLNVPLIQRVEQLRLTLERWRWAPHEFSQPPIIVNIPEFLLRAWNQENRTELQMNIVVGKAYRHKTPVFSSMLQHVVFRPYWNVPISIQRNELVPKIRKDPAYLAKNDYEITTRSGQSVSAGAIGEDTLKQLSSGQLSIRQRPGPKNSLGAIKFVFPNDYDVYMHDTPQKELFQKSRRDSSHGCIRLQDPLALALWVLKDNPEWTADRIVAAMKGERTLEVTLTNPIPVLVVYGTAVVPENGDVHFYRDIYGYDATLEQALADR